MHLVDEAEEFNARSGRRLFASEIDRYSLAIQNIYCMTVSSRTPEGEPHRCPVCGNSSAVEPSYPEGDSCCPTCGQLLWWFRDRLSRDAHLAPETITLSSLFINDIGANSVDMVELVMELEEEFDITIPHEDTEQIHTVADAVRYIEQHRHE